MRVLIINENTRKPRKPSILSVIDTMGWIPSAGESK
jgi:hypothetical protein